MIEKSVLWVRRFLLPGVAALLLSSCFETKQEFTLNPDGSGKVVHESVFQRMSFNSEEQDAEQALKSAVLELIEKSEGVDAWDEVAFKTLDDGRMWFRGTAYFPDINKFKITNKGMLALDWKPVGKDGAVVSVRMDSKPDEQKKEKPEVADRDAWLKEQRAKFQQSKPMMAAILAGIKHQLAVKLPGKVDKVSNFKPDGNGRLTIGLEGSKMLEAMETLVADDQWLLENGFDNESSPQIDARMAGMLFGENAPAEVRVSAMNPQFDYKAEVAEAVKKRPELEKRLGAASLAPPAKGEPLKSIRVVGVRHIEKIDSKLKLRPFHQNDGLTLALLAELPGSVLAITDKSRVETAVTHDGTSILKDKEWDRRLGSEQLSEDNSWALFEINVQPPAGGLSAIKEITGLIQYKVASGTKKVDLGFDSLKPGSSGKELDATIKEIKEDSYRKGEQNIEIKLNLKPDDIKEVRLLSGKRLADGSFAQNHVLKRSGYSGSNSGYTFTYRHEGKVPEDGTIEVELYDGLETFDVPFKVEDFNL